MFDYHKNKIAINFVTHDCVVALSDNFLAITSFPYCLIFLLSKVVSSFSSGFSP
jgi:hypothetical protein